MAYGTLTLITGPMFAGKSTELLKRVLWAMNGEQRPVAVLKPAFDVRYAVERIVSHDGLAADAVPISAWPELDPAITEVFLDEAQFLDAPRFEGDLVAHVRETLARGVRITASGLDMDWQGRPFPMTAALAAMADEVVKLRAHCSLCGRPATKTLKRSAEGGPVDLGGADKYEPRCNAHWHAP